MADEEVQKVKIDNWHGEHAISLGELAGAALSFMKWHSIMWAMIHGMFWWFYLPYYIIRYGWN